MNTFYTTRDKRITFKKISRTEKDVVATLHSTITHKGEGERIPLRESGMGFLP